MTTTRTLTPSEAADRAREKAEYAEALERRLREGADSSITAAKLQRAQRDAEHSALVAEGAKTVAQREAAEDRARRGRELHDQFVGEIRESIETVDGAVAALTEAVVDVLEALDGHNGVIADTKAEWSQIFVDARESETALVFKAGHSPTGEFGALDAPHIAATPIHPVQTLVAAVGEALTARSKYEMPAGDKHWWDKLRDPTQANGIRALRTLSAHFEKENT